jgi:hypothetical protein
MTPTEPDVPGVESDGRFPSGPWTGFFLQPPQTERHWMELLLMFREGIITGEGRDKVGEFLIKGRYQVEAGKCWWTKTYIEKHSIAYQGYNEGKGIWGTWEFSSAWKGGFHIWPVAMGDPTQTRLSEAIEGPKAIPEPLELEPVGAPAEVVETVSSEFGQNLAVPPVIKPNQ